ncbi:MAG: peptidase T [Clostridia bacterium BRH_c25]|nr:MAG: peptidase T [Clostridia bacterium BRH_c25]
MHKVVERFLKYVSFDTTSIEESKTVPSTPGQLVLARELEKELEEMGLEDISLDGNGYLMATLPANTDKSIPTIGFLAHMDTSDGVSGANIKTSIVKNYDGGDILLNKQQNLVLSPKEFPELTAYIGQDLITTDGTTLLGADDKAGIAEIITAVEHLLKHPEIPHGTIRIAFTPDEEIARGTDYFDLKKFNADFAYTIDGGQLGELEYENFNAAKATIVINGKNAHPGTAKDKMINSMLLAMELNAMLPQHETPGHTEGYEGFFHLEKILGRVEMTSMMYIIRDFDKSKLEARKECMRKIAGYMNDKYGKGTIVLELVDQYSNMREKIEPVIHVIENAKKAMEAAGVTPIVKPIRGGTDGARLSLKGLPTPNIFTGGHNYHGRYEYISVNSMNKAVEVILKLVEIYSLN